MKAYEVNELRAHCFLQVQPCPCSEVDAASLSSVASRAGQGRDLEVLRLWVQVKI